MLPERNTDVSHADASFADVALPHLDAAYNLARWLVGDRATAEDVVQTAMLRALAHFEGFRGESARGWLLKIVRNTAYTSIANRGREPLPLEDEAAEPHFDASDAVENPEMALASRQERDLLGGLLASLSPELRECLVLRELEEMSYQQIAEIADVPIGTVMSRLWRARRTLIEAAGRSGMR